MKEPISFLRYIIVYLDSVFIIRYLVILINVVWNCSRLFNKKTDLCKMLVNTITILTKIASNVESFRSVNWSSFFRVVKQLGNSMLQSVTNFIKLPIYFRRRAYMATWLYDWTTPKFVTSCVLDFLSTSMKATWEFI